MNRSAPIEIVRVASANQLDAFRSLCREYASSLPEIGASLEYQGFEQEMASLPACYAEPEGVILIAGEQGDWLGCVALRPMPELGVCEMKRMYVRPAHRSRGIGRQLGEAVVAEARRRGYRVMRLDTDRSMRAAITVYRRLGFVECERYNDDPCEDTLWFELDLEADRGGGQSAR